MIENPEVAVSASTRDAVKTLTQLQDPLRTRRAPSRQPTLYGIDFKITPDGDVKLIEVNGANAGTGGFAAIYGDNRVKEGIVERMRTTAGGKRLVVSGSYARLRKDHFAEQTGQATPKKRERSPLYKHLWWWYAHDEERRIARHIFASQSARTMIVRESEQKRADNQNLWNGDFREYQRFDENNLADALFLKSTERFLLSYDGRSTHIKQMDVPVLDSKGERIADSIEGDDIGLFWDRWGLYFGPMHPGFAVVNPAHHKLVCANKLYVHHLLSKTDVADALVPSMPLGLGIETREQYDAFMREHETDVFVLKPVRGSRGYGVRMVPRAVIESEEDLMGRPISKLVSIEEAWAKLPSYCFDFLHEGIELLSPYVPSKEVRSERTAKVHDACMRAIVFNGEFIDAYWRLAPEPMAAAGPLEGRLRANMSRGAIAQAPMDEEREIAKAFSESIASALDRSILPYERMNYPSMEVELCKEMLGAKHGLEYVARKRDILQAAKKKRAELGMYSLTARHVRFLRDAAIVTALWTPAMAELILGRL